MYRELNFKQFIAILLNELGEVARYKGDYEEASTLYSDSLNLFQEQDIGFESNHAMVLLNMGYVAYRQGHHARARELFGESLLLYQRLEEEENSALCLVGMAGILVAMQRPEKAVSLISAARTVFDTVDVELTPPDQAEYEHNLAAARTQLDMKAFEAAWAEGRAMRLEQAIAYALGVDAGTQRNDVA